MQLCNQIWFDMKRLLRSFIVFLFGLVFFGGPTAMGQDSKVSGIPQREGIRWDEIHFGPENDHGEIEGGWLLFFTPDGATDSLQFTFIYTMKLDFFYDMMGGQIEEEDINFDGIPDLQISIGCFDPGCNNFNYEGYVWDQEQGTFILVPVYSQIFNPSLDEDGIISIYREWDEGEIIYSAERYHWVNGELVKDETWSPGDDFKDE